MQLRMSGIDFSVPCPVGELVPQQSSQLYHLSHNPNPNPNPNLNNNNNSSIPKKKRNLPGKPDPEAEVIALSPNSLITTNRFICEICNKGFQRDQNLQLHRRGHNLPWKLTRQKINNIQPKKKVYICPEKACVHHDPARALGDLTGIKKHFSRKHGEKKWKCEKCSRKYAVRSDWKAHSKTCGTREYKCDCGTLFSRKDSFITHRAFCDALADESLKLIANSKPNFIGNSFNHNPNSQGIIFVQSNHNNNDNNNFNHFKNNNLIPINNNFPPPSNLFEISNRILVSNKNNYSIIASGCSGGMSATALLLKAAQLGSTKSNPSCSGNSVGVMSSFEQNEGLRDFLGTNSLMEMTKFGSSEMGLSRFVRNDRG